MTKTPRLIAIICFICLFSGCRYSQPIVMEQNDCSRIADLKIEVMLLRNGDKIYFNNEGGKYYEHRSNDSLVQLIIGIDKENEVVRIPIADVVKVGGVEEQSDTGRTALLTVLSIIMAEIAIIMLAAQ